VYVCHCEVVCDGHIRAAIAEGARDVDAVTARCGAGGACGGCVPAIEELLAEAVAAVRDPALVRARQARRRRGTPRRVPVPAGEMGAAAS
jgi:bacterioferritin-associated ferredoxin